MLFDAGNTLIFLDPRRVARIFDAVGVPFDPARFRQAELEARLLLTRSVQPGESGTEPERWRDFFRVAFHEGGVPVELMDAVAQEIRKEHRQSHLWTYVDPATPGALRQLKDAGYRLGVISNADGRMEGVLEEVGLRPHFEFVIDSGNIGVEKPSPRIFEAAAERLRLDPAHCLYVGDLFDVDVVGARGAGMQAVLLDPWDALDRPVDRIPSVSQLPEYLQLGGV